MARIRSGVMVCVFAVGGSDTGCGFPPPAPLPVQEAGPGDAATDTDVPTNNTCVGFFSLKNLIPAPFLRGIPSRITGDEHRYQKLTPDSWANVKDRCGSLGLTVYLAVPDDPAELAQLATLARAPFWIGISDIDIEDNFFTSKGVPATFLPWAASEPDDTADQDCVTATADDEIATAKCIEAHEAVCECEP